MSSFPYDPQPTTATTPMPVLPECAVGTCRNLQLNWDTGFCDYHQTRFEDRVHDHTREIGRGSL